MMSMTLVFGGRRAAVQDAKEIPVESFESGVLMTLGRAKVSVMAAQICG